MTKFQRVTGGVGSRGSVWGFIPVQVPLTDPTGPPGWTMGPRGNFPVRPPLGVGVWTSERPPPPCAGTWSRDAS